MPTQMYTGRQPQRQTDRHRQTDTDRQTDRWNKPLHYDKDTDYPPYIYCALTLLIVFREQVNILWN